MRGWTKAFFVALFLIISLPIVIALFTSKTYTIEKEVTIEVEKDKVFEYLRMLDHQKEFSVWAKMDPDMDRHSNGRDDGEVGYIVYWKSDNSNVGEGEQEIMSIREGERIDYEIRFKKPFESTDKSYILTIASSQNSTTVKWVFEGFLAFPMNLLLPLMDMEHRLGDELQESLINLKTLLEHTY